MQGVADLMRARNRVRAPDRRWAIPPDHSHALGHCSEPPGDPAVRTSQEAGIAAAEGKMTGGIQSEGTLDYRIWAGLQALVVACLVIRPRMSGEHEGLPPEPR